MDDLADMISFAEFILRIAYDPSARLPEYRCRCDARGLGVPPAFDGNNGSVGVTRFGSCSLSASLSCSSNGKLSHQFLDNGFLLAVGVGLISAGKGADLFLEKSFMEWNESTDK